MWQIEMYNPAGYTAKFTAQAERPEDIASNVHDILVLFGKTNQDMVIEIKKAPDNGGDQELLERLNHTMSGGKVQDAYP